MAGQTWNPYGGISQDPMNQMMQYGDTSNFMRASDFTGSGSGRLGMEGIGTKTPGTTDGGTGMFGMSNSAWGNIGTLGQIGSAVGSYIMGNRALDQADEKFEFQKDSWEKQFAMMQDQYYRKLNNRRANRYTTSDMSQADRNRVSEYYDSGSNLNGAYQPSNPSQQGAPTPANAQMMNQATGGAPFSPAAAQGMLNAGQSSFNKNFGSAYGTNNMSAAPLGGPAPYAQPAPSQAPINPAVQTTPGAGREIIRRKKVKPKTQSGGNGVATNATTNEPQ